MPEHVDILDPELHEPKGVGASTTGTVYVSNGSGSGTWSKVGSSSIDTLTVFDTNKFSLTAEFPDITTVDTILIPLPYACTLNRVTTILHGTIGTANKIITVTNTGGPVIGTVTVAFSGSAEGDIDTLNATTNNTFTAGSYVKLASTGGTTTARKLGVLLEFTRTGS